MLQSRKETRLLSTLHERLNGEDNARWWQALHGLLNRPDILAVVESILAMSGYLKRLIDACHFARVSKWITEANFPLPARPVSDSLEYVVFQIKEAMTRAEIIAAMALEGLRPATLYELLVWAARNPREGTQYLVIALAEYFAVPDGYLRFAYILPSGWGGRELSFYWIYSLDEQFNADYRFLAVRKSSEEPLVA